MSVRYRLFVIVGLLFCAIFMGSFFVENRLGIKGAKELKKDLLTFYQDLQKQKRDNMQNIVQTVFFRCLGDVNAALEVVSSFRRVKEFFAPTKENLEKGTWISSASLLQDRETIDFLQNSYGDTVSACIIPRHAGLRDTMQEEIDEDLCWIFMERQAAPYLGVALHLSSESVKGPITEEAVPGIVPRVYLLYTIDALKSINLGKIRDALARQSAMIPLSVPFMGGFRLDLPSFVEALSRAQGFISNADDLPIGKDAMNSPLPQKVDSNESCTSQSCFLSERVSYVNQIFMIWELSCLLETGIMDGGIGAPSAPSAISFFPDNTGKGGGVFVRDVLYTRPQYDAASFFFKGHGDDPSPLSPDKTAIITDPQRRKIYIANAAELSIDNAGGTKSGLITLGFDVENALKNLTTGYRQKTWVVSGGKIYSYLDADGSSLMPQQSAQDELDMMLSKDLGLFSMDGVSYYFAHIRPFDSLDLHIFFFTKADEEFSLMNRLSDHFQDILTTISSQRHWVIAVGLLILLVALLDLSKKITRPVVLMSEAARAVTRGALKDVVIPKFHLGKRNEVQQLSLAFSEMIEGLKEKERVKGVLDKVVSHDIAREILKGDVHLGGEDKVVTMFFADVRNFTHLTQNMPPHRVINLVNTCMTKLSRVIEAHHGVIDKYIGDEVMVLFGAPIAHEDSALEAVRCAIDVIAELKKWNEERRKEGLPPVTMGIGIHTGKVCAGNMGAEDRLNYTVIGSNVNLAARLCSKAPPEEIYLSDDTYHCSLVAENILVEDMGPLQFKGFDEPKKVYRVKGKKT